jgi:hypothetical protein
MSSRSGGVGIPSAVDAEQEVASSESKVRGGLGVKEVLKICQAGIEGP